MWSAVIIAIEEHVYYDFELESSILNETKLSFIWALICICTIPPPVIHRKKRSVL